MTKKKFSTDREIKSLQPLAGKRQTDYYHRTQAGFGLRVSTSGTKSWFQLYHINEYGKRKRRKVTVGTYPNLSLADARKEATKQVAAILDGADPAAEKKAANAAPTVSDLFDYYFEIYVVKKGKAASSIKEDRRQWETLKDKIGHVKAHDVRRKDLIEIHTEITQKGSPVMANRTLTLISTCFAAAIDAEMIDATPCTRLKSIMNTERARERVLNDDEIKLIWEATANEKDNMRDIIRLTLITAQRPGEVAAMEESAIDQENHIWTIPGNKTKNGQTHQVPLSAQAWQIIEPRLKDEQWLFPSRHGRGGGGKTHTKSTKDARRRLKKATGVEGWTTHDLRRTARTLMAREKVPPHIAERVLNHKLGKMQAVYDQYGYLEEKTSALNKLADAIDKIIGVKREPAKIYNIAGRRQER